MSRTKFVALFLCLALLLAAFPAHSASAQGPEPAGPLAGVLISGSNQRTPTGSRFPQQFKVRLLDASSLPVSGSVVTFTAPASGASGTFADSATNVSTATTDAEGFAIAPAFRANGVTGSYLVEATFTTGPEIVLFGLSNYTRSSTANFLQDGGFESSLGNTWAWSQYSYQFGTPLCSLSDCYNLYDWAGPHRGSTWIWFGGVYQANENGFVQQTIIIPPGPAFLRFYLWTGYALSGSDAYDNMVVSVDGNPVFTTNANEAWLYPYYKPVAVDISGYADGGYHTIQLQSTTTYEYVNFNVDDVSVSHSVFADVLPDHWAWSQIETLYQNGITGGCSSTPMMYCDGNQVTRAEMAVFLLRAKGTTNIPAATGTMFTDVPASYWAAAWIEELARQGITSGCGVNLYCPDSPVFRDQMAVFLLRAVNGSAYAPAAATGTMFTDVPASYWDAAWIEQMATAGITSGCSAGKFCPGSIVTRDQMAVFLGRAFGLK